MISLIIYNRHWQKGFFYPFQKKRFYFSKIKNSIDSKFITIIAGLRRTGKTVLLFQTINFLIEQKNIPRENILYFTFDEENIKLEELLYEYEKQTGISWKNEKIYIFLDEIQKLDNFQNQLKIFYDLYPNIKFFISGSTSLFIKKKSTESLAGREVTIILPPLSFKEYLFFLDLEEIIEKPLIYHKELRIEFEKYFSKQFIETLGMKKEEIGEYYKSLVKKIIFEDIPVIYNISEPDILLKIVKLLANYPGTLINYEKISDLFDIDRKTLSKYFNALNSSYLVKILYNFSKNLIRTEKKLKKAYLNSSAFVVAYNEFILNDDIKKGLLAENAIISVNDVDFFWREKQGKEVDIVKVEDNKIKAIEIKYVNKLRKDDFKNLLLFKKRFSQSELILLCPDELIKKELEEYSREKIELKSIYNF